MATEKRVVFSTKKVEELTKKINDGYKIPRELNPWWKNEIGIRKSGLSFSYTKEEMTEYYKCAVDIHYFAENYCKIKTEDGKILNIKLRDYQEDILDLYMDNRFSVLAGSRQIGKCISPISHVITESGVELPIYKLFYTVKKKKNIYDKIKYILYSIIYKLS